MEHRVMSKTEKPTLKPFNPLDKRNLGDSVAEALLHTEVQSLPPEPFYGAGVYALYYTGSFTAYHRLVEKNSNGLFRCPIYIGKAVPPGARKGGFGIESSKSNALHKRLVEHAESIRSAVNLEITDFYCRFLAVDDIWIPLSESVLIERFKPVWNSILDGFGNHNPGSGRHQSMMPQWDCLHPGRAWAEHLKPCINTAAQLAERVDNYLQDILR
jgi:hypothetical protein